MTAAAQTPPAGSARILIVDDSRAIQAIIRRVVERMGYPSLQLQSASDGEQALKVMDSLRPHLVLSDWHMPSMSGLEMFQLMRQAGHTQAKVGFITTETSPPLMDEAKRNGAAFILHKPFRDEDLVREIGHALPVDAVPADQAPPEADASRPPLLEAEALQALIKRTLGEIPFRVIEHTGLSLDELTEHNLLAIYGGAGRPLAAVAVLDARAVCIIGGGAAGMMPSAVRPAMASGQPTARMVELSNRFLGEAGRLITVLAPGGLQLSKSSLVAQSLPMLGQLLSRSQWRVDVRVSVPGYGDGRLSLLAV